jgi:hypothetical protein
MRALFLAVALLAAGASPAVAFIPHPGHYVGSDDRGRPVDFVFVDHLVKHWTLDGRISLPDAWVNTTTNAFSRSLHQHNIEGRWTDVDHVRGTYFYYRRQHRVTIHWTAHRKVRRGL